MFLSLDILSNDEHNIRNTLAVADEHVLWLHNYCTNKVNHMKHGCCYVIKSPELVNLNIKREISFLEDRIRTFQQVFWNMRLRVSDNRDVPRLTMDSFGSFTDTL